MPTYDYRCNCGVVTEARQGVDVKSIPCPACGHKATRQFSCKVALMGLPTRGTSVPTCPEEKAELDRKDLKRKGWDGDRAMEFVRKGVHEDEQGHKVFSPALAEAKGG